MPHQYQYHGMIWIKNSHRSTGKQPLIVNIQHLFVKEGPRVPSVIHQFTNSCCFTSQFCWGEFASTGSHCYCNDFTVPEITRNIVLFSYISILLVCRCTLFNHTGAQCIQQSNRQVPMKQFVMFQRLLLSLCQSVSAPS
jgi:hypothetical protein